MIRTVHRAKFILAESDLLLQNAAIHVSDPGRISRIEPWQGPPAGLEVEVVDWGTAVILPGFVNAHTHLELTNLHDQIRSFSSFTGWLTQVVQQRRHWSVEDYRQSTREGARLALSSGTSMVGDISTCGISADVLRGECLRKVVFEESISLRPEDASKEIALLEERLNHAPRDPLLTRGVSPHAPYSVSARLFCEIAQLAQRCAAPIASHIAETLAELQLLESGTGEFKDFLTRIGALPADWQPPGLPPVAYLESLQILQRSPLLVHGNYLDAESMRKILAHRCSVVFCPRSHAFFGFDRHPVRQLLSMGINVALGTDSLASNSSLSMLDEARYLYNNYKDLSCQEILRMATLNGAAALGHGGVLGRLRRGYWADLTILQVPENMNVRNLVAQVLEGAGQNLATIVAGQQAWSGLLAAKS